MEDVIGSVVDANGGGVGARIRRRNSANPRLGADNWDGKEGRNDQHHEPNGNLTLDRDALNS